MSRPWRAGRARPPRSFARKALDLSLAVVILGLIALLAARLDRVETRRMAGSAIVNDGDTITIAGEKIRLRGIDAPEYSQTCRRGGKDYACGREAREALRRLIGGQAVSCAGWQRDRFGRLLGECKAGSTDLNRALVAEGWAVAFGGFEIEEFSARKAGRGLWAGEFDRPRQWRDSHGSMAEDEHDWLDAAWNWLRASFGFG
ncbi:thermonuclease family protein [Mesorhizobium sp. LHD-90]|uniref:thermonuclease family protein n=1 Tax=Mesorhizobium sp. LHD-90 TaxID=3071414 RepID=UPI0027E19E4F|nr:thermonuclease family protein [Mesorhizobium sp. LHD-90]MDQ6437865.1 thermonuclease family protein [Mesorhizobium sp. LHD-90]